jgi:hypothetical protein
MKRITIAVSVAVLVFAVAIWAQTTAPKPDPELKKFDVWVGHWTMTEEYKSGPLGSYGKGTATMTMERILGGFFFRNQMEEKGAMGAVHTLEIIGYDPVNKNFFSNEYHDDGNSASGTYVFDGNTCTYTGKFMIGGKPYMTKNTVIFAADWMSFTAKAETSVDGATWTPIFEGKGTKKK